jgi:hypothetical protein
MPIAQTFSTAFTIAYVQAIAAMTIAALDVIRMLVRGDAVFSENEIRDQREFAGTHWADFCQYMTWLDLALVLVLIIASHDALKRSGRKIQLTARAFNPRTPEATIERLITLSGTSALICLIGLVRPPVFVANIAERHDIFAATALWWPIVASTILAFFLVVLIGSAFARFTMFR